MAQRRLFTRRQRFTIFLLVGTALALMLLPRAFTGRLITLAQAIIPFQFMAERGADALAGGDPAGNTACADLETENAGLQNRVAALTSRTVELENEIRVLTASRLWEVDERRIGARGQLLPARVVGGDVLSWRDSLAIDAGSFQGVRRGAAVTSDFFALDRGTEEGVRDGLAILLAESLIGYVQDAGTHAARVRLISDVASEMKVRLARVQDGDVAAGESFYWLSGIGGGQMRIRDVERRDVESGDIAPGDLVLSDHTDAALPAPMVIGRIVDIQADRQNPLLAILTVAAAVEPGSLHRVYVYDPAP